MRDCGLLVQASLGPLTVGQRARDARAVLGFLGAPGAEICRLPVLGCSPLAAPCQLTPVPALGRHPAASDHAEQREDQHDNNDHDHDDQYGRHPLYLLVSFQEASR